MITVTCESVLDPPTPRIRVTVQGLPLSEVSVTVWRTSGGERIPVRGARGLTVIDSFFVEDFEAPLAQRVAYQVEVLSGAGAGETATAETSLASECGYIQDPRDPSTAVPVWGSRNSKGQAVLRPEAFSKISYAADSSTFRVMGSRYPVSISSDRGAPSGISLVWRVAAAAENTRLRDLVQSSPQLVIRPLPSWGDRIPPSATYSAATFEESKVIRGHTGNALTEWSTTGDVVRPHSARVIVSLFSYQDVAAMFATYDEKQLIAGEGTYLDDQKDPTGSTEPASTDTFVDGGGAYTTTFDSTLDGGA